MVLSSYGWKLGDFKLSGAFTSAANARGSIVKAQSPENMIRIQSIDLRIKFTHTWFKTSWIQRLVVLLASKSDTPWRLALLGSPSGAAMLEVYLSVVASSIHIHHMSKHIILDPQLQNVKGYNCFYQGPRNSFGIISRAPYLSVFPTNTILLGERIVCICQNCSN